jgi:hypothetical protein
MYPGTDTRAAFAALVHFPRASVRQSHRRKRYFIGQRDDKHCFVYHDLSSRLAASMLWASSSWLPLPGVGHTLLAQSCRPHHSFFAPDMLVCLSEPLCLSSPTPGNTPSIVTRSWHPDPLAGCMAHHPHPAFPPLSFSRPTIHIHGLPLHLAAHVTGQRRLSDKHPCDRVLLRLLFTHTSREPANKTIRHPQSASVNDLNPSSSSPTPSLLPSSPLHPCQPAPWSSEASSHFSTAPRTTVTNNDDNVSCTGLDADRQ